jgi:vancomycin permeability regulator SanA
MEGLIKTVVVLGGGISEEGILPIWVRSRLEKAIQLYSGTCNTQLIVCGKGRDNFPVSESKAMADYLIKSAVPTDAILQESLSTDTIQNAYFTWLLYIEPQDIHEFTVVTNEFHLKRAEHIFNWVFGQDYHIEFIGAADESIDTKDLEIRKNTEAELLCYHESELSKLIQAGDTEAVRSFIMYDEDANAKAYKKFTAPYAQVKALY